MVQVSPDEDVLPGPYTTTSSKVFTSPFRSSLQLAVVIQDLVLHEGKHDTISTITLIWMHLPLYSNSKATLSRSWRSRPGTLLAIIV